MSSSRVEARRPRVAQALCLALVLSAVCGVARAVPIPDPHRDDIFYEYMPIAWRDSDDDPSRFGDFGGMTAALPYLRSLGVTAVWMTPIFDSPAYHGYQHLDPLTVNPRFGTEAEFLDFVRAAHADSVKVFIDLVAYMVSTRSAYFQQSYRTPSSPFTDLLAYRDAHTANRNYDGGGFTTWNGDHVGFIRWNLATPAAVDSLVRWTSHWLDPNGDGDTSDGVDGYRLDHVVLDEGWGYTLGFWQTWKQALERVNPQVFTFAEQGDWASHGSEFLSAHDAAFTKPFLFAARRALAAENASELYAEMGATLAALPAGRLALCTLGDHDVNRLASDLGDDAGRARSAAAVLLLQPLPPVIYFGDELGMRGRKGSFGSDADDIPFREPFKWTRVQEWPMSRYSYLNPAAQNSSYSKDNDGRSVEEESGVSGSLLETYRGLAALRLAHPALRHGAYAPVSANASAVWAFTRLAAGEESVVVAINVGARAVSATLDLSALAVSSAGARVRDVATGLEVAPLTTTNRSRYPVALSAHGWATLRVSLPATAVESTTVDGRAIPEDFARGAVLASQTHAPGAADNRAELDRLFALADSEGLRLGVTGNLPEGGGGLAVFAQSGSGGQRTLALQRTASAPAALAALSGLTFDDGFAPTRVFWISVVDTLLRADLLTLAADGGATVRHLGSRRLGTQGPLAGGFNPGGAQAALDNSNRAGADSLDAGPAATATHGCELLWPWDDLAATPQRGELRLCVALVSPDGMLGDQMLPGLPAGTLPLGRTPVSLAAIGGTQYATLSLGSTPAAWVSDLRVAPLPVYDHTNVQCTVSRTGSITARIVDLRGRRIRDFGTQTWTIGSHTLAWDGRSDAGLRVASGLYLLDLRAAGGAQHIRLLKVQ